MKNCMNVAAGVFGVMVPVALLVCGWNVLAPEKWCWVERGISIWGGAIATAFLFLFAAGYERSVSESPSGRFLRRDASAGAADAEHEPRNEKAPLGGRIGATRQKPPRNARPVFARKDDLSGYAEATSLPSSRGYAEAGRNTGKSENAQDARKKGDDVKTGRDYPTEHIPPCQAPAKVGKKD